MSRIRNVGGTITKTTRGDHKIYSEGNIVQNAGGTITETGKEKGVSFGKPDDAPKSTNILVIDAYFAKLVNDKYERIKWAGVEEEIYVVIKTNGLVGKTIEINILDRDGILTNNKYGIISALQDDLDKKGEYKTNVRDDGFAIFKLQMKPSKDVKAIKEWRDKIGNSNNKKVNICILVDAHSRNSDLSIIYMGKNSESDVQSEKAKKHNYWLDTKNNWFELRRKNPVIVIDPGHGYTKGNTGAVSWIYTYKLKGDDGKEVLDEKKQPKIAKGNVTEIPQYVIDDPTKWVLSVKEDPQRSERFLVYDVSSRLKNLLDTKGYKTLITRERGPIVGSDDGASRKQRIDLAKNNKADYFISVHADGVDGYNSSGSHVIYPSTDNSECIELATDIFSNYDVVEVESNSPKIDVRGLQVLSQAQNTVKRKVLVELGFVTTPKDSKALFLGVNTIAQQLYEGLIVNINKNF